MHTVASNKVSAKDRELAPRFYYKVSEKTTCGQKLRNALKIFLTFMFTQVGVIVLIGSFFMNILLRRNRFFLGLYMVGGAFVFQHIEQDSLLEHAIRAENVTKCHFQRWNIFLLIFSQFRTLRCTSGR